MFAYSVVSCSETVERLKWFIGERGANIDRGTIPSPGKIELSLLQYDFPQVNRQKKFGKNGFHTLQGTMFYGPLTNTSSFKITAA
jgi:hypothetical protein